jgi:hypothetical protein
MSWNATVMCVTFFGRKISASRSTRSSGTLMAQHAGALPLRDAPAGAGQRPNRVVFPAPALPKMPTSNVFSPFPDLIFRDPRQEVGLGKAGPGSHVLARTYVSCRRTLPEARAGEDPVHVLLLGTMALERAELRLRVCGRVDDGGELRQRDARQRDAPRLEDLAGDLELVQFPGDPGTQVAAAEMAGVPPGVARAVEGASAASHITRWSGCLETPSGPNPTIT